jgi:hypothetical protein
LVILIAFIFILNAFILYFRYPELCQVDTTPLTNLLNLPLCNLIGMDGEGANFCWFSSLLVDETAESFRWIFEVAFPLFYGNPPITTFITDCAFTLYEPLSSAISELFPGATRILCAWHAIDLYIDKKCSASIPLRVRVFVKAFLKRMCIRCETIRLFDQQWNEMLKYLLTFVNDETMTKRNHQLIIDVLNRIKMKKRWLFRCYFPHLRNFGQIWNNRVEGEHRAQKRHKLLNRFTYLDTLIDLESHRFDRRENERENQLRIHSKNPSASLPSHLYLVTKNLTSYAAKLYEEQYLLSTNCVVGEIEGNTITVKYQRQPSTRLSSNVPIVELPQFPERVRHVYLLNGVLKCTCHFIIMYGIPCCHLIAVKRKFHTPISLKDFHLRHFKQWYSGDLDHIYYRSVSDGFDGISSENIFSLHSQPSSPNIFDQLDPIGGDFISSSSLSPSLLSQTSPPFLSQQTSSSSTSTTTSSNYHKIVDIFRKYETQFTGEFAHNDEVTSLVISKLQTSFTSIIDETHQHIVASSEPSILPIPRALITPDKRRHSRRAQYCFETNSKKRRISLIDPHQHESDIGTVIFEDEEADSNIINDMDIPEEVLEVPRSLSHQFQMIEKRSKK